MMIVQAKPSDFHRVNTVLNEWWGGRQMTDKLPHLFFDHFYETSFIAEQDGHLIGFLIGFLSPAKPNEAYIHFVGVHPDYRKSGLARTLYHHFFDLVKGAGRSVVMAVTSPVNKTSIAYHTKIGFECLPGDKVEEGVPVHTNYDGKDEDRVVFRLDFNHLDYHVRPYSEQDIPFLWEMLYQSIYIPEGEPIPSRDILKEPEIEKYFKNWGGDDDHALLAVDEANRPLGAIWIRKFSNDSAGYGFVDEDTPELGMALLPQYRGKGIGSRLLKSMASFAQSLNIKALSLSVDPRNLAALRLYEKNGYVKLKQDDGGSWVMKKELK